MKNGKTEILNSDQGSQFTCIEFIDLHQKENIKISRDVKGRALDNVYMGKVLENYQVSAYIYIYIYKPSRGRNNLVPRN